MVAIITQHHQRLTFYRRTQLAAKGVSGARDVDPVRHVTYKVYKSEVLVILFVKSVNMYKCSECSKSFSWLKSLKRHFKQAHVQPCERTSVNMEELAATTPRSSPEYEEGHGFTSNTTSSERLQQEDETRSHTKPTSEEWAHFFEQMRLGKLSFNFDGFAAVERFSKTKPIRKEPVYKSITPVQANLERAKYKLEAQRNDNGDVHPLKNQEQGHVYRIMSPGEVAVERIKERRRSKAEKLQRHD